MSRRCAAPSFRHGGGLQWAATRIVCVRAPGSVDARPLGSRIGMRNWVAAVATIAFVVPSLAPSGASSQAPPAQTATPKAKGGDAGLYEQLNLFSEAFERIRQDAVEPVGDAKLLQTAITGMLAGLDPHS